MSTRRLIPLLALFSLWLIGQQQATAAPGSAKSVCYKGVCWVVASDRGSGGTGGSARDTTAATRGSGRCQWQGKTAPCKVGGATFNGWDGCYYKVADTLPTSGPVLAQYEKAGGGVYWETCPFGIASGGYVWRAQPPAGMGPTPAGLAQRALDSLTLTKPSTGRYPAGTLANGEGYTVVRAATWYFTDPSDFQTLRARAAAGSVWAQVTVRPAALTFRPGDGNAAVSCAGPGTAWNSSYGVWAASPSGCDYRYPHSSIHELNGEVTATYGIRWQVSWVGSGETTGTLPDQTTTANSTFAVAEEEALVIK